LGMREFRSPSRGEPKHGAMERAVVKLGGLPQRAVIPLMAVSLVVLVAGVLLEDRFKIQSDVKEWVNQDTQVIADLDRLDAETGSSSELGYFIQVADGDVFTDQVAEFVHEFATGELDSRDRLLTASSLITTVSFLAEVPGAEGLPPRGEEIEAAYD